MGTRTNHKPREITDGIVIEDELERVVLLCQDVQEDAQGWQRNHQVECRDIP